MIDLEKIRERNNRPAHDALIQWAFRMESGLDCAGSSSADYFGEIYDLAKRDDENLASELAHMVAWLEPHNHDLGTELIRVLLGALSNAPTDIAALIQEVERMRAVVQGVRNMMAAEEDVETLLAEGADLDSEEVWHARDTLQGEALATYEALARLDANDE